MYFEMLFKFSLVFFMGLPFTYGLIASPCVCYK